MSASAANPRLLHATFECQTRAALWWGSADGGTRSMCVHVSVKNCTRLCADHPPSRLPIRVRPLPFPSPQVVHGQRHHRRHHPAAAGGEHQGVRGGGEGGERGAGACRWVAGRAGCMPWGREDKAASREGACCSARGVGLHQKPRCCGLHLLETQPLLLRRGAPCTRVYTLGLAYQPH